MLFLNSLDAIQPSANKVLQLQDAREELKAATGVEVTHLDICSFMETVQFNSHWTLWERFTSYIIGRN